MRWLAHRVTGMSSHPVTLPPALTVARELAADGGSRFQSFVQPLLLAGILVVSLSNSFASTGTVDLTAAGAESLRAFYVSFTAAEFYSAVLLLITILVASQYGTYLAAHLAPPVRVLRSGRQFRSPVAVCGSLIGGTTVLVTASVLVFMGLSTVVLSVVWPWGSAAFWILLASLIVLSVSGGLLLAMLLHDSRLADLVLSVVIFGSALAAGAFFPYPEQSALWSLAPGSPFTPLLTRVLQTFRDATVTPAQTELMISMGAALITGSALLMGRRTVHVTPQSEDLPGVHHSWEVTWKRWLTQRGAGVLAIAAIVLLPVAVAGAIPPDYVISGISLTDLSLPAVPVSAAVLYPYGGFATVLLFLYSAVVAAPLVSCPPLLRRSGRFRRAFFGTAVAGGLGAVALSTVVAAVLWATPGVGASGAASSGALSYGALRYGALALSIILIWSITVMAAIAEAVRRHGPVLYWPVAVTTVLLLIFLGGGLWNPRNLGVVGTVLSGVLPHSLLLYRPSGVALLIAVAQIGLLATLPRWVRLLRRRSSPTTEPRAPMSASPEPRHARREDLVHSVILRERARILEDVHDTLGHGITGALWQIRSAQGMAQEPELQQTLRRAEQGLEQGLQQIRVYLRDAAPRKHPDWSELRATVDGFTRCPVHLNVEGNAADYPAAIVTRYTRSVQELLTNALRYGEPEYIHIHFARTARMYRMEYLEHGAGWGAEGPRMGFGLSALQTLFTEVGGSFELDSLSDTPGVRITGSIPVGAVTAVHEEIDDAP